MAAMRLLAMLALVVVCALMPAAVALGRDAIQPGVQDSSFTNHLPTPVLGVLTLLGTAALTAGALALKRKLRKP